MRSARTAFAAMVAVLALASCAGTSALYKGRPGTVTATSPPASAQPAGGQVSPQPSDIVVGMSDRNRHLTVSVGQVIAVVLTIKTANGVFVSESEAIIPVRTSPGPVMSGPTPLVLTRIGTGRFRATFTGTAWLAAVNDCSIGACAMVWRLEVTVRP